MGNGFSHGAAPLPRSATAVRQIATVRMEEEAAVEEAPPAVEYSESLPMLVKRPQLKGYAGDVGFDPVGFSEILPMDWLREAELKHCRVSMLATVGFAFTDFYHLPGFDYTTLEAHDARRVGRHEPAAALDRLARALLGYFHRPDAPRLGT